MDIEWTVIKALIDSGQVHYKWIDAGQSYIIMGYDQSFQCRCILSKDPSDTTELDQFESSYKVVTPIIEHLPFASKKLHNNKSLFARNHGASFSLSSGSNTEEFVIPYTHCKFTEIEILGTELGDSVDLKILDDVSGTYSGVPNYQLNQFGFSVYLSADYYRKDCRYDADLYSGMRIVLEYDSVSAKTLYVNFTLHEVK